MINVRTIKLVIAYDGTDFSGWQKQDGERTVQGEIEEALKKIHKHPVVLHGAGRTDSGVHAAGQCAHFITDISNIPAGNFVAALNGALPRDVRIRASRDAPDGFHARFCARYRTYRFYFIAGLRNFPHETRFAVQLRVTPSLERLNSYARLLHGETDCSLFASPSDRIFQTGSGSKFRNIRNAVFFFESGKLVFEITANAFFKRMVRSVAGTLLECEAQKKRPEDFAKILAGGSHEESGPVLSPAGLFLARIEY